MDLPPHDIAALAALANGIIPADDTDAGAASVNAGERLAEKLRAAGPTAALYRQGLETAVRLSSERFAKSLDQLTPQQMHDLLGQLRDTACPAFFKQLRTDVCALYLADPGVWQRIGFPGPSTATGGYPDFDQPQTRGP
jgi:Gluconate 2-dehydrogenase subunit 3